MGFVTATYNGVLVYVAAVLSKKNVLVVVRETRLWYDFMVLVYCVGSVSDDYAIHV